MARGAPVLTAEQARILLSITEAASTSICDRWSPGIWYGLIDSLKLIDNAGGAYVDPVHATAAAVARGRVED